MLGEVLVDLARREEPGHQRRRQAEGSAHHEAGESPARPCRQRQQCEGDHKSRGVALIARAGLTVGALLGTGTEGGGRQHRVVEAEQQQRPDPEDARSDEATSRGPDGHASRAAAGGT